MYYVTSGAFVVILLLYVFLNVLVQETIKAFEFGVESVKQSLNSIETNQGMFHSLNAHRHNANK